MHLLQEKQKLRDTLKKMKLSLKISASIKPQPRATHHSIFMLIVANGYRLQYQYQINFRFTQLI
jgi:hypothetical protein